MSLSMSDDVPQRAFQSLLPGMIAVMSHCLQSGDEQGSRQLFDVFETLLILVRRCQ